MMVRVDEAGNDNTVRGVNDRCAIRRNVEVRLDVADFAVLDQDIAAREIADLPVQGQHDATLEQNTALPLDVGQVGILRSSALRRNCAGQHLRGSAAGSGSGAGREERAA